MVRERHALCHNSATPHVFVQIKKRKNRHKQTDIDRKYLKPNIQCRIMDEQYMYCVLHNTKYICSNKKKETDPCSGLHSTRSCGDRRPYKGLQKSWKNILRLYIPTVEIGPNLESEPKLLLISREGDLERDSKNRSERRKHYALAVVTRSQKFSPHCRPAFRERGTAKI